MRIDKFLKNSWLIKRRSVASEACGQGRVFLNGRAAKPAAEVKIGDELLIRFGNADLKVRVLALTESTRKEDAAAMYEAIP
jgi:ribosomal 50S subunit-recycling heat shock protein